MLTGWQQCITLVCAFFRAIASWGALRRTWSVGIGGQTSAANAKPLYEKPGFMKMKFRMTRYLNSCI
jgi:hypothetical protein